MTAIEENGPTASDTLERTSEDNSSIQEQKIHEKMPYIPDKSGRPPRKDNRRILFIGVGIVFVLLLLAFNGISKPPLSVQKNPAPNLNPQKRSHVENEVGTSVSITPILEPGHSEEQAMDSSRVEPEQLGRMTSRNPEQTSASTLADIPPFADRGSWHPAPYREGAEMPTSIDTGTSTGTQPGLKQHEAMDEPSLVFVAKNEARTTSAQLPSTASDISVGIGLPPGTRLRARLESAVSTAIQAPAIAVIEYNYEQNGEILVPAGSRAFGHIESADRSGYIGLRFDSLLMPNQSPVALAATASDLRLQPLRGKVEGRHTGKNVLLRSFAGIGEITATLVGRGSLNQPLSESDLLRERISNNIGEASDQSLSELAINDRIVVSLPSDTEFYVILQKDAKPIGSPRALHAEQVRQEANIDQLRQLLQLQHEMNQKSDGHPPD